MPDKKDKNLLGDIYDCLANNRDFITPQMFSQRHQYMSIDYDAMKIQLNEKYTIQLTRNEKHNDNFRHRNQHPQV